MAERKDRMALLSRYQKLYTEKYGEKPIVNLNVEQWTADALIESFGMIACYDLLQYYFSVAIKPEWKYFANYTTDIIASREQSVKDTRERLERRRLAKKWLNE
jgi:hypothetical protein